MLNRHGLALSVVATLIVSVSLFAQKKDDKKQSDEQKKEVQALVKMVDDVAAGQAGPNDLGLAWLREDYLKAQGNKEYAPFAVTVDPAKASGQLSFYWRVVAKGGAAAAPAPAADESKDPKKKDDKKNDDKKNPPKRPEFAYEDVSYLPAGGQAAQGPTRIQRSFTVPAGTYDVYVAVKEPTSKEKNAPMPKAAVIKQSVTVPDFWNNELTTSSVIVAQRIDPLPAPLTPQQQVERPYALGGIEIVPVSDLKLPKKTELQTFMIIYNPKTDSMNKPDVQVEYNFYSKAGGAEKFFNKTTPQSLNAQTLPPQFDVAAGHQLQAGQGVPLSTFPEGDYRLEIKVTDKIANKSISRDVNFSVTGS